MKHCNACLGRKSGWNEDTALRTDVPTSRDLSIRGATGFSHSSASPNIFGGFIGIPTKNAGQVEDPAQHGALKESQNWYFSSSSNWRGSERVLCTYPQVLPPPVVRP